MDEQKIRELLEFEISKTKKRVKQYEALSQPVAPDNAIGRVSRMDAINNKGVMDAALVKARERLEGLKRNLGKLGSKEFGVCARCGRAIAVERILLAPHSAFCVNCAV